VSSAASGDGLVQQAVQQARVLRDQLLLEAQAALEQPGSEAWGRVAEACGLTAGLIGGIGGARCRTVAAHAVHNGLTQLAASHGQLHGEKVGYGILVQLRLEEVIGGNGLAAQARRQLLPFFQALGLPVSLADLGLGQASLEQLNAAAAFACRPGSDLHHLPFPVDPSDLLAAMVSTAVGQTAAAA
jgi:glycerol dehydrogenase